jgi:hypothetical protein
MGVLLCRGDDTSELSQWVHGTDRDPRRIVFYPHPDVDVKKAFAAWSRADLPIHSTRPVTSWRELHRHFGAAWNVRIFDDFNRSKR